MRWHLCNFSRAILQTCEAPDRLSATGILRPSAHQYVISAASYRIPDADCVTHARKDYCAVCGALLHGDSTVTSGGKAHRGCYESVQRFRRNEEINAMQRAKRERAKAKQDARPEQLTQAEAQEVRRNATIAAGIERRKIKRTLGIKPKRIVPN